MISGIGRKITWVLNFLYQIKVLDEFLNDMKQKYRIDELQKQIDVLKMDLMQAVGGYVTYRMLV